MSALIAAIIQSPNGLSPYRAADGAVQRRDLVLDLMKRQGRIDDAAWKAADMCLQTHGGFGFAEEYDIERKFRETRLFRVAPISTNLVLSYIAEHVLGLPRSF